MAVQSKHSHSGRQLTGAGDDEAATSSRKKNKRPTSSSLHFESHHPTTGATVCNLTPSQTARITQQFDQSLIAWVVGKKIHPRLLTVRLRRNLHLAGDLDVFELGLGFFVLKFSNASDYYEALEERPWSISHLCIYVFPWIPNFKPSEASIPFVDVWIRLPELSIEYYDEEVLERIAETIGGRLVKIDPVTERREKCMYARICIRINLCNPLNLSIQFGRNRQIIIYEGWDLLCPVCRCVDDLKHDCLSNPSESSGFDPHHHRARPLQAIGSSLSSNSNSKKPLIPSEPSPASAWGSRFQVLEKDPLLELELNEGPSLPIGECDKAGNSPYVPVKAEAVAKQKGKCGVSVSVQTLPILPKESSTITMKAPELKQTNLIQSVPLAPSVVEDQFRAAKTSRPTTLAVHNNESQPSSLAVKSIASLQPCPVSEAGLNFYSTGIQCSTRKKVITDTPAKEIGVHSCPTVYTIDPTITSLAITLSEAATTMASNQNQYTIDFVPTSRGGDKCGVGSEAVPVSESCYKKMLCWNFRGTDNAKLIRALKDLIQLNKPSIVLIFGTKISGSDADQVVQELVFDGSYCRKPDGYNGGVWLLLSRQDVQIEVSSYSPQQVSASVHFHAKTNKAMLGLSNADTGTSSPPWGHTFFYASMAC